MKKGRPVSIPVVVDEFLNIITYDADVFQKSIINTFVMEVNDGPELLPWSSSAKVEK